MAVAATESDYGYDREEYGGYGRGHGKREADAKPGYGYAHSGHSHGDYYGKRSADPLLPYVYPHHKREAEAGPHHVGYGSGYRKREAQPTIHVLGAQNSVACTYCSYCRCYSHDQADDE